MKKENNKQTKYSKIVELIKIHKRAGFAINLDVITCSA